MKNDVYRLMVLAIACNLSCDEAYAMLQQSYIDAFVREYNRIPDGPQKPTVLDAMINFTMKELPIRTGAEGSITFALRSRREEIVTTFIKSDVSKMITALANRDIILEMIRGYLRRENNQPGMYAKINSSRVNEVFTQFIEMFEHNCAHAFQFEGSFKDFVMNCYIQFFHKGRKRDIWAMIKEVDTARREVEQSIVQEKILHTRRTDDVPIHDLVLNISLVNDLLFKHSGQSDDARGVQYDIYYLLLCELCEKRVQEINEMLGEELLVFVDPHDRKEARLGVPPNKGIAAKVGNAKELIPPVFEYVRAGKLNTANLADLRDRCFKLGKHDREGRNCVWSDVVAGGETSRYLDTPMAAKNYEVFDQIVKGVVSVHTLMTEIESRGQCLVDSYVPDLFRDKDIIRYIDYLSSVSRIDLIRTLQREPVDYNRYGKDLLEFPDMVDEYAGSAVNNHTHIRENRYYAITHGFLDRPRLKQTSVLATRFDKLRALSQCLDATPRSYREYLSSLHPNQAAQYSGQHFIDLPSGDVVGGKYSGLYSNVFVASNKDAASYYLRGDGRDVLECLDDLTWRVGTAQYEAVLFMGVYGLFLPLHHKFFFFGDEQVSPFLASWEEVNQIVRDRCGTGGASANFAKLDSPLRLKGWLAPYKTQLSQSIGFSYEVGIANLGRAEVQNRIDRIGVTGLHKKYIAKYYAWLDENSRMQYSIMEVMRVIFTEVVYLLSVGKTDSTLAKQYEYAQSLLQGFFTGEFKTEPLNWILEEIRNTRALDTMDWSGAVPRYRRISCEVLDYCFGNVTGDTKGVYSDLIPVVEQENTPASKFLAVYNHVYTKLEFLRYLRDAYSLTIDSTAVEASTLVCELSKRFRVEESLMEYCESDVTYGARTEDMSYTSVKQGIWETRNRCYASFKTLITELTEYFKECEGEIAKLIVYGIAAQSNIRSRFAECGQTFAILPDYPPVHELQELRRRAGTDSAGFFLLNGSYFKGKNGGKEYYVHRTGRMVTEDNGRFIIAEFNFSNEDDKRKYCDTLSAGLA